MFPPLFSARPSVPPVAAAPSRVARHVHFGRDVASEQQQAQEVEIRPFVRWYHENIRKLLPLRQQDRSNHSEHMIAIGRLLGLLPPSNSAGEAVKQYAGLFNTLEKFAAPVNQPDRQMRFYESNDCIETHGYQVKPYIFHVLVFAPNGAVERFRRVTPLEADVRDGKESNLALRTSIAKAVRDDVKRLGAAIYNQGGELSEIPHPFSDETRYQREVFAPGQGGLDAWGQPFVATKEQLWLQHEYSEWKRRRATFENINFGLF